MYKKCLKFLADPPVAFSNFALPRARARVHARLSSCIDDKVTHQKLRTKIDERRRSSGT